MDCVVQLTGEHGPPCVVVVQVVKCTELCAMGKVCLADLCILTSG